MIAPELTGHVSQTQRPSLISWAVKLVLVLLVADAIWKFGFYGIYEPLISPNVDFLKHWYAGHRLRHGHSPYYGDAELYLGFNYPLFTGWLFVYLSFFSAETARIIWLSQNLLLCTATWLLVALFMRPPYVNAAFEDPRLTAIRHGVVRYWPIVTLSAFANYHPILDCLKPANVDPFNLVTIMAFAALWLKRRDWAAGVLLAVAVLVKIVPILLLVPIVLCRRWRVAWGLFGALGLYALILLVTGTWRLEVFLYQDVLPQIGFHYRVMSLSLHKLIIRLRYQERFDDAAFYNRVILAVNVVLGFVYSGVCWVCSRRKFADVDDLILAFSLAALPLFSPLLEFHHFVWAAPALFIQLRAWAVGRIPHGLAGLLLGAWIALNAIRVRNNFYKWHWDLPPLEYLSLFGMGIALLSVWAVFAVRRTAAEAVAAPEQSV